MALTDQEIQQHSSELVNNFSATKQKLEQLKIWDEVIPLIIQRRDEKNFGPVITKLLQENCLSISNLKILFFAACKKNDYAKIFLILQNKIAFPVNLLLVFKDFIPNTNPTEAQRLKDFILHILKQPKPTVTNSDDKNDKKTDKKDDKKEDLNAKFKDLLQAHELNPDDPKIAYQLGNTYRTGQGTKKYLVAAIPLLLKAEQSGEPGGLLYGIACFNTPNKAVQKKGLDYFTRLSMPLYYFSGLCYAHGITTPPDLQKAIPLFKKAAITPQSPYAQAAKFECFKFYKNNSSAEGDAYLATLTAPETEQFTKLLADPFQCGLWYEQNDNLIDAFLCFQEAYAKGNANTLDKFASYCELGYVLDDNNHKKLRTLGFIEKNPQAQYILAVMCHKQYESNKSAMEFKRVLAWYTQVINNPKTTDLMRGQAHYQRGLCQLQHPENSGTEQLKNAMADFLAAAPYIADAITQYALCVEKNNNMATQDAKLVPNSSAAGAPAASAAGAGAEAKKFLDVKNIKEQRMREFNNLKSSAECWELATKCCEQPMDLELEFQCYQKMLTQFQDPTAYQHLAHAYATARGTKQDKFLAYLNYRTGSEIDLYCRLIVSAYYRYGVNFDHAEHKAYELASEPAKAYLLAEEAFNFIISTPDPHPDNDYVVFTFAQYVREGVGVKADEKRAENILKQHIKDLSRVATFEFEWGNNYFQGINGFPQDFNRAAVWLEKLINKNHPLSSRAQHLSAFLKLSDAPTQSTAVRLLQDNYQKNTTSKFLLAFCQLHKIAGLATESNQALSLCQQAAADGDKYALCYLHFLSVNKLLPDPKLYSQHENAFATIDPTHRKLILHSVEGMHFHFLTPASPETRKKAQDAYQQALLMGSNDAKIYLPILQKLIAADEKAHVSASAAAIAKGVGGASPLNTLGVDAAKLSDIPDEDNDELLKAIAMSLAPK